jgi:Carboxypeptidase regulatory-like domain
MNRITFKHLTLPIILAAGNLLAFSQVTSTSSISGAVTDPNGAMVAGAEVIVKNNTTTTEYSAVTGGNGVFTVPALGAGAYTVTVSAAGFKQAVINNVKLDAGVPASVRITLEIGAANESVTIQGGGEVVQTQSANIATTLVVNQITNLPLVSRNASDFIVMLPGVNTTTTARNSTINGLPQSALNITIDGINVQDNFNKAADGFYSRVDARLDAIEEVTISTATPGAESSGQGAVQIKYVTRQGGNKFHGSLYEYHRNPSLNANYWFNNRNLDPVHKETGLICGSPQQPFDREKCKAPRDRILFNQYGFRVGGPIMLPKRLFGPFGFDGHNKAFFFVNYEEFRFPSQVSRQRTIFNPLTQQGVFQYNVTVNGQPQVRQVDLLDLAARDGQTSTIDPVIGKLLADIRNSTTGKGGIQQLTDPNLQRFTFANDSGDNRYFPTLRLDFNLTEKHHLESSYNYQENFFEKDIFNTDDPAFPGFPNFGSRIKHIFSGAVALRSTLSQRLVNEARVGLSGGTTYFSSNINSGMFTGPVANQAGFNLGGPTGNNATGIAGAAGISGATINTSPNRRNAPLWDFSDTLSWTRGAHSLSFGGSFTQTSFSTDSTTVAPAINFGVNSNDPAISLFTIANFPGASSADLTRAQGIYAALTGRVTSITANAQLDEKTGKYVYLGQRIQRGRQREFGFFAQDAWRARPNLTLNYGLRWELQLPFTPLNDSYTTTTVADLFGVSGPGNLFKPGVLTGRETQFVQYKQGDHAYNTDYKNFGPSFGFAWSLGAKEGWLKRIVGEGAKTALRGGYAIAYNRQPMASFSGVFGANPGSFVTATRSLTIGNLVTNQGADRLPVLLRETNRLGPAPFPSAPTYPLTGAITNSANIFDPNLKVPYVQSWSFGLQREIVKDTALEVRYVGNRQLRGWTTYDLNEDNIVENGFLNEFKLAMTNLQANIAAGRGANFRYFGPNTGTAPLPIILSHFSGIPASQSNDPARYTSSLFTSNTFLNSLALNNPAPTTFAANLYTDAARRANALNAGLPANFFLVNPGLQGGANFTGNGGYSRYDSMVVELRRRLSKGLLAQGSYVFAKGFNSSRVSFRAPRVNSLGGTLRHAFKVNWVYELPVGRSKTLFGQSGALLDRIIGGWEFDGAARVQSGQVFDFGNVRLVGMTMRDLRQAFKLRFDDANRIIYSLPQDIIDNTIRAFNASATSPTGYGSLGPPTGRYIAPANSASCIQVVNGDCAPQNVYAYGPMFTRFDLSAVKRIKIKERVNFEFRGEFLNAFNNTNFFGAIGTFSSATLGQVTTAYRDSSNTNDPGGRLVQIVARLNF